MTSTTVQVLTVANPAMPRGARLAAGLFIGAARWLSSAFATRPATPAQEAAEVREFAYQVRDADPRFAADLYAAADRHELLTETAASKR